MIGLESRAGEKRKYGGICEREAGMCRKVVAMLSLDMMHVQ